MALQRRETDAPAIGAELAATRYGPNWPQVVSFIEDVRGLSDEDGKRIRRAYLESETPPESGAATRAEVTSRVVRAAIKARRMEQHRQAIVDCRQALGSSRASSCGMGVHIADLAGALVVLDRVDADDMDFLVYGWRVALDESGS